MDTLHEQLAELAEDAPVESALPGLWQRGQRRRRQQRAVKIGAVMVAVLVVVTLGSLVRSDLADAPGPADVPFSELHLPRTVHVPHPWSEGTDETGPPGPLAVVSTASRARAAGVTGVKTGPAPFGISAVDGSAVFLDLRGGADGLLSRVTLTLSPDGTKVGYVRYADDGSTVLGFAVYDALDGSTTFLEDPRHPEITLELNDLTFSGDSRYLETTYSPPGSGRRREHALVVWDVGTGDPLVAEPSGAYWIPNMGEAPTGTVWSRGRRIYTFDPYVARTTSARTDFEVVEASYGPGSQAFAAIAFGETDRADWRLMAGAAPSDAREVPTAFAAERILGWTDAEHVVIGQLPELEAFEVDLTSGSSTPLGLGSAEELIDLPSYAGDLWANPLVEGTPQPTARDPRLPLQVLGGASALAALLAVVWVLWRRRRARS